jgi:mono/diheme cytochrome c family protein
MTIHLRVDAKQWMKRTGVEDIMNTSHRWSGAVFLAATLFAFATVFLNCARPGEQQPDGPKKDSRVQMDPVVTPVEGPSWLKHLGITNSPMGRMGGTEPPQVPPRQEPPLEIPHEQPGGGMGMHGGMGMGRMMGRILSSVRSNPAETSNLMNEEFSITGADLYRLNCQSCHGPGGKGSPPGIKSLLGPVQGTSPAFIKQRMDKLGRAIDDTLAEALARDAEGTIRQRLQNGGEKMPPFHHLANEEVDVLLQYLQQLAAVRDSGAKPLLVTESVARVGEHVIKGTCHTCHDATGPGGGHMAMMSGIIPSLASFPKEQSMQNVVRQVELGSSSMMSMMNGETMPAMPFITANEAAAAYLYLAQYPPKK